MKYPLTITLTISAGFIALFGYWLQHSFTFAIKAGGLTAASTLAFCVVMIVLDREC